MTNEEILILCIHVFSSRFQWGNVHTTFLGLGEGLCCSSIYAVRTTIAPNDKVPFDVLIDNALFFISVCSKCFLTFVLLPESREYRFLVPCLGFLKSSKHWNSFFVVIMEDFSYLPHSSAPFRNKARLTCAFSTRLLIFGAQMHLSVLPSINWPMHFGYLGKHQKRNEWTFDLRSFIWHWKCAKDAYCCFFYFATPNC